MDIIHNPALLMPEKLFLFKISRITLIANFIQTLSSMSCLYNIDIERIRDKKSVHGVSKPHRPSLSSAIFHRSCSRADR